MEEFISGAESPETETEKNGFSFTDIIVVIVIVVVDHRDGVLLFGLQLAEQLLQPRCIGLLPAVVPVAHRFIAQFLCRLTAYLHQPGGYISLISCAIDPLHRLCQLRSSMPCSGYSLPQRSATPPPVIQ